MKNERAFLTETNATFRNYKNLAERAIAQVSDEEIFRCIDGESNSIAIIAKHIGGNLLSRWTDFLTSDGEKPFRDREEEFVQEGETREDIMKIWEGGWAALFTTLESLTEEDLTKTVTIRTEEFTVVKAILRSLTHTVSHVGQITFLAKYLRGADWRTLSVPRGKTAEFNKFLAEKDDKGNYLEAAREFAESNN